MVDERAWRELTELGPSRLYRRRAVLVRQDELGEEVFVVASGRITVHHLGEDGTQGLVAMRGRGDLVGELGLFKAPGRHTRSATVTALDDCHAHRVPLAAFRRFCEERALTFTVGEYMTSKLSESVGFRRQLIHFRAEQRIARLIQRALALAGPEVADPLRVPFSQQELADALGLSRSKVAEVVRDLRAEGILGPGPHVVVADPVRFRDRIHIPE